MLHQHFQCRMKRQQLFFSFHISTNFEIPLSLLINYLAHSAFAEIQNLILECHFQISKRLFIEITSTQHGLLEGTISASITNISLFFGLELQVFSRCFSDRLFVLHAGGLGLIPPLAFHVSDHTDSKAGSRDITVGR